MARMHGMGGPHGGGGGHHHHGGGGGGRRWGGPIWYGYDPYPTTIVYADCVRDPLDLRRCLPPEAVSGLGGFYEDNKTLVHIAALVALVVIAKKAKVKLL